MSASLAGSPWWWPYVVILIAGALATQVWRWLGVLTAGRIALDGPVFSWARMVAAGIIAALTAQLIMQPQGALQILPLWVRLVAVGLGLLVMRRMMPRGSALTVGLIVSLIAAGAAYLAFGPA